MTAVHGLRVPESVGGGLVVSVVVCSVIDGIVVDVEAISRFSIIFSRFVVSHLCGQDTVI